MIRQTKTENGLVRGIEAADPRITAFRGVPFAAPPTGKNRDVYKRQDLRAFQ